MKRTFNLIGLMVVMLFGMMITGCCDDEKEIVITDGMIKPIKAPDFKAFAGGRLKNITFNTATRAHDVDGNLWYQNWGRPTNVTESERAKVIEEFSKKREGAKNTLQVTWENFWVQQVYKGETSYTDGYGQSTGIGSNHMDWLLVFNTINEEVVSWWPFEVKYTEFEGDYEHINNFNSGDNQTVFVDDETHQQYIGTTLMTHIKSDGRDEQFAYHNSIDSKVHSEYIILEIDGAWYIGFDFYATKPADKPTNDNMDVERDWIFNDWIVKVCPAQLKVEEEIPTVFPDPTEPIVEVNEEGEEVVTFISDVDGHVEVNLSLNAKKEKDDYIFSKLSIHVRDTTDVELHIPVPAEYYSDTDDMNIVISHREELEQHAPSSSQSVFTIDDQVVKLSVTFEMGGIRIKSDGINAKVLKYLRKNYGDGITFEVYNYYNSTATRDFLKPLLDKTSIAFTNDPKQFINAIAKLDGTANPLDCSVTPSTEYVHKTAYDGTTIGNYNVTYTK